ncbi:MAG: arylamine N-acetyltransferase [Ignavibacteria bacterium]|nr:arylamine N-acetyltransferase [Ignavibacteria bacterium]
MNNNILFNKYLNLLGVEAANTSFNFLCELVKAHLIKVPFENISKLLFKKQGMNYIPDLSTFLEGIEKHNFGGTCYSNNYYFYLLLNHLGFNVKLCGADMKNPDVHIISMVNIDGEEYIVDGGYAAPFLKPLPRNLETGYIINNGNEKYIVNPMDENGRTKVEQYINNELRHWYKANPQPRKVDEFQKVIEDSYEDDSTFMNALRITRFSENGSLILNNLQLIKIIGSESVTVNVSRKKIPLLANEQFGMPENLVSEAIENLKELQSIYD